MQTSKAPVDFANLSSAELGAFLAWWERLHHPAAGGTQRADRAVLRRCDSLTAVACSAAYQRAYFQMAAHHEGPAWAPWQQDRLAMLVALAAHIKQRGGAGLPQAMGGKEPAVSELRFRRLLEAPDAESLFTSLRRVLPLIKQPVDLAALAQDLVRWGDGVKKKWAYAYYAPAAVSSEATD